MDRYCFDNSSVGGPQAPLVQAFWEQMVLPSPVCCLEGLGHTATLWLKDDSRLHPVYGGNKCRKLRHVFRSACLSGKNQLLTFGAAGSHHVLATGLFAKHCGFHASALIVPHPWSVHAEEVLRATIDTGINLIPARIQRATLLSLARIVKPGGRCEIIWPGGSNVCGAMGYFEAAAELAGQVRAGLLPEPDLIVLPFGSAGTAAGLWAGLTAVGLRSRIVAVSVIKGRGSRLFARHLAQSILKRASASTFRLATEQFVVDDAWVGGGYGLPTQEAMDATKVAAQLDLTLDPTYTSKAFACALALAGESVTFRRIEPLTRWQPGKAANVLYWHTLSALPSRTILRNASPIPRELACLFRPQAETPP